MSFKQFVSTDTGALALSGTAGDLTKVLASTLVLRAAYSAISGGSFVDNSDEARLNGGSTFKLFQTPGTSDEFYVGLQLPFTTWRFKFGTAGIGGTYVFEYWNGSAWTTLTVTDGTSGFTTDGQVVWVAPGSWATTSVNSLTCYWIRIRCTGAPSTNPLIDCMSLTDWQITHSGTNTFVFRANTGARQFLLVNDNGPGTGTGKEARIRGWETKSNTTDVVDASNTGQFPTAVQLSGGCIVRKSTTADGTARVWQIDADHRTFYMNVFTGDTAGIYYSCGFGEYYYTGTSSPTFNSFIIGRSQENVATSASAEDFDGTSATTPRQGHFLCRAGTMTGTAVTMSKIAMTARITGFMVGTLTAINGPDNAWAAYQLEVWDITNAARVGRMRGWWVLPYTLVTFTDRTDTFAGTDNLAGKSLRIVKGGLGGSGGTPATFWAVETSDTLETN